MGRRNHAHLPRPTVHSRTGKARLRLGGKEFWLGPAGSPEADRKYTQLLAAWVASNGQSVELPAATPPAPEPAAEAAPASPATTVIVTPARPVEATLPAMTVGSLTLRYLATIKGLKSKDELRGCSKWWNARLVANALETRRTVPLESFGPKMLKDVQAELATRPRLQKRGGEPVNRTRYMVNRVVKEIVRMFEWAVSEEIFSPDKLRGLESVKALREGESSARESDKRVGVADQAVEAILPHLPAVMADLVRFARITAVRPSEACRLCMADIERMDGPVWRWTLARHKTAHKGKIREIAIGPRARKLVERWAAGKEASDPVFAVEDLKRAKVAGTIQKRRRRKASTAFTATDIRKDVAAACKAAGVEHWTPYALRHAGATEVRHELGLEAAQAHCGHASAKMTEHYAAIDFRKKSEVALRIG